jgi:hypothetical protein
MGIHRWEITNVGAYEFLNDNAPVIEHECAWCKAKRYLKWP